MFISKGFTLIELIAFIVIIGILMVTMGSVFQYASVRANAPLINSQLISMAQSQLDETLSRKYDEATPTGGIPACNTGSLLCVGIGLDTGENINDASTFDDVDDFNDYQDIPQAGYTRRVSVVFAGSDFSINNEHAKRIIVTVTSPQGESASLSTYRFNF